MRCVACTQSASIMLTYTCSRGPHESCVLLFATTVNSHSSRTHGPFSPIHRTTFHSSVGLPVLLASRHRWPCSLLEHQRRSLIISKPSQSATPRAAAPPARGGDANASHRATPTGPVDGLPDLPPPLIDSFRKPCPACCGDWRHTVTTHGSVYIVRTHQILVMAGPGPSPPGLGVLACALVAARAPMGLLYVAHRNV